MSLIPYHPPEGREIVLRHQNAIVVRDTSSQRLEIRSLALECPTCHQPIRPPQSADRSPPAHHDPNFVDPNYFRMLRHRVRLGSDASVTSNGNNNNSSSSSSSPASSPRAPGHSRSRSQPHEPSSPILRLTQPALASAEALTPRDDIESSPPPPLARSPVRSETAGGRIRREAFMPNYFSSFFVEEGVLGRGGKGVVLLVRHEIDGCNLGHYACKRVPVGDNHDWLERVLIEVELLSKFSHPNLVQFRHVWLEDVKVNRFGPRVACAFILQKYCNGGDLLHYIIGSQMKETTKEDLKARARHRSLGQADTEVPAPFRRLSFEEIYSVFKDITSGLAYLHAANYVHRDLKPSNCLLHGEAGTLTCLLSDFGEVQPEHVMRRSTGATGTISYCAPEVLGQDAYGRYGNFTTKSDMFSLGMILYFLCFGRLPYHGANMVHEELEDIDALRAEIAAWQGFHEERRSRPDLPSKLYQLLKKLLARYPAERPSAAEVLTAMNSEGNHDGATLGRSGRGGSPVVELHGRRIQNLDSPLPPSTPEPTKSPRMPPKGFPMPNDNTLLLSQLSPRRPPGSPPRASRTSPSPTWAPEIMTTTTAAATSAAATATTPIQPRFTTPLLLPPPATALGTIGYRLRLGFFKTYCFVVAHMELMAVVVRLALFFIKMTSLSRPCWPYMARRSVALPLVGLAGLDLAMHGNAIWRRTRMRRWVGSAFLLLAHFAVLFTFMRWGVLCAGSGSGRWRYLGMARDDVTSNAGDDAWDVPYESTPYDGNMA